MNIFSRNYSCDDFILNSDNLTKYTEKKKTNILINLLFKEYEYFTHNYNKISNITVLAIGLTASGNIYFGINVECTLLPIIYTIHAEQFLITNAYLHNELSIENIIITHSPCGYCRQFLMEINNIEKTSINFVYQDRFICSDINKLIPYSFSPKHLNNESPLFTEQNYFDSTKLKDLIDNTDNILLKSSLQAFKKSYAPYSKNPQSLAVKLNNNEIYESFIIENVAFNPSLSLPQVLIINFIIKGIPVHNLEKTFRDINEAIIVKFHSFTTNYNTELDKLIGKEKIKIYNIDQSNITLESINTSVLN